MNSQESIQWLSDGDLKLRYAELNITQLKYLILIYFR